MNTNSQFIKDAFTTSLDFIDSLRIGKKAVFLPCHYGITNYGKKIRLSFCCLALKTYYMLGAWYSLPIKEKNLWTYYIKSFQNNKYKPFANPFEMNSFIDPHLVKIIGSRQNIKEILKKKMDSQYLLTSKEKLILGETKQAIATLLQVNDKSFTPYNGFFIPNERLESFVKSLGWNSSWGAGGLFSAYSTLLMVSNLDKKKKNEQKKILLDFLNKIVDKDIGCYSLNKSDPPEMINGAMKVLTALDYLEAEIHYPKQLIDFCLAHNPPAESCFIVDNIYVLFRCSKQLKNTHKFKNIKEYLNKKALPLIKEHYKKDGGFSYFTHHSQTDYYGARISTGKDVGDIHGTTLLLWALFMINELLEIDIKRGYLIKP